MQDIICPTSAIQVLDKTLTLRRPQTQNFPAEDTLIFYLYTNAADGSQMLQPTKYSSQSMHTFNDVPMSVTRIRVIALGKTSQKQDSCEFDIKHTGKSWCIIYKPV